MKHKRLFFLLLLTSLVLLTYLPSLKHELIWDSRPLILENDILRGGFFPAAPFTKGYWESTSQGGAGYDYYRPLTVLSFMAEKAVWGLSPWRLRLANLLMFIAALFCLYFFLLRQAASRHAAEAAVLLFALFPPHLDNINWVVGRCDLLMLLFGILALLLFDLFLERRSPWLGLLALASYSLALLAKEAGLFFLPLFPLHELIRRRRLSPLLYISPLIVSAGFWLLKSSVIGRGGFPLRFFASGWESFLSLLGALGYYSRSLVFPFHYDMFLPLHSVRTLSYIGAGALFAFLLASAPLLARKRSEIAGAWFWIAPFLGGALLMVFTPIHPHSISTRYLMVPAIGWTWLLGHWLAVLRPAARRTVLALLLTASAVAIVAGSQKYRGEAEFWKSALVSEPNDGFFMSQYAGELKKRGDFLQGEVLLRRALAFRMNNATAASITLKLADAAITRAHYREALDWLQKMGSLPLDPLHAQHRFQRLLKIHRAGNDLAAAEEVLREMEGALPAGRMKTTRVTTYLAFAEWEKARSAAAVAAEDRTGERPRTFVKEEEIFRSPVAAIRARYFIGQGNFAAAWEAWPEKDAPGVREQLGTAKLALLAGLETEGQRRVARLVKSHENDFRVLNSVGNLLYDLQRAKEALPAYRRSLLLNPGQPALAERVGRISRLLEQASVSGSGRLP